MKKSSYRGPNSRSLEVLLPGVFQALACLCEWDDRGRTEVMDAEQLKPYLLPAIEELSPRHSGRDSHLQKGAYTIPDTRRGRLPEFRLGQLVLSTFCSLTKPVDGRRPDAVLPSPLFIILKALTDPEVLHSEAYAQYACLDYLFRELAILPDRVYQNNQQFAAFQRFTPEDLAEAYSRIETETQHRDSRGGKRFTRVEALLLHYFAFKGLMYLRFGPTRARREESVLTQEQSFDHRRDRARYCEQGSVLARDASTLEFRKYPELLHFPDVQEVVNELFGTPIPIRGFNTIFAGGLRPSSAGGLVMNLEGAAGTGKTSLALAIAASMTPFGSSCVYFTLEEATADIEMRASSVLPEQLARLSYFTQYQKKLWLYPVHINGHRGIAEFVDSGIAELKEIVADQAALYKDEDAVSARRITPNPCPLVVVIDSLAPFVERDGAEEKAAHIERRSELHRLIEECRTLGALVVLLSESDEGKRSSISYLVDISMRLEYRQCDRLDQKPVRVLELLKTRHQVSRPGSHVFHLSGKSRVRVSPQIPSLIDARSRIDLTVPTRAYLIPTLEIWDGTTTNRHTRIRFKSHVMINGIGSSGKAALGMRLLMTPLFNAPKPQPKSQEPRVTDLLTSPAQFLDAYGSSAPRVLVISFLYPERYYKPIERRIRNNMARAYQRNALAFGEAELKVDYLALNAGYLNPEDFVGKIDRRLDAAVCEGRPYSGVLIDGLHNVYLQFPSLQTNPMIWPALYTTLRRLGITTVTTFTSFDVRMGKSDGQTEKLNFDKHLPLLHALIQSTDYSLTLTRIRAPNEPASEPSSLHVLQVKSGIGGFSPLPLLWDSAEFFIRSPLPSQYALAFEEAGDDAEKNKRVPAVELTPMLTAGVGPPR